MTTPPGVAPGSSVTLPEPVAAILAARRSPRAGNSWLTAMAAVSLDGRAALEGTSGQMAGPTDRLVLSALRAEHDAVLAGAGTVRAEGYRPVRHRGFWRRHRARTGRDRRSPLVVITRTGALPADTGLWEENARLILATPKRWEERVRAALPPYAGLVVAGGDQLDWGELAAGLADLGFTRLLLEGGPTLFGSALAAGAVDELHLTLVPRLIGGADALFVPTDNGVDPDRWRLDSVTGVDGDLYLRYLIRPEGGGAAP